MTNRHNRCAAGAKKSKPDGAEAIRLACRYLATIAEPTATGATLFLPDGCTIYLSADDARAVHGREAPRGGRT